MVARGDLGVEIGARAGAGLSKTHHRACAQIGRSGDHRDADAAIDDPQPRPTRAEATDVANAILDGTTP